PHELHLRSVRRVGVRELRSLARRPRAADERVYEEHDRRSAEDAARFAKDDVPAVAGGRAAARRVRFLVSGHGAGRHASSARRSVPEVCQRAARRDARRADRARMRAQRPLRLHDRRGAARHLSAGEVAASSSARTSAPSRYTCVRPVAQYSVSVRFGCVVSRDVRRVGPPSAGTNAIQPSHKLASRRAPYTSARYAMPSLTTGSSYSASITAIRAPACGGANASPSTGQPFETATTLVTSSTVVRPSVSSMDA